MMMAHGNVGEGVDGLSNWAGDDYLITGGPLMKCN